MHASEAPGVSQIHSREMQCWELTRVLSVVWEISIMTFIQQHDLCWSTRCAPLSNVGRAELGILDSERNGKKSYEHDPLLFSGPWSGS